MSDEVPNLRGGSSETIKWLVSTVGLLGSVAAIVWGAAKYPDRSEFNEMRNAYYQMKLETTHRLDVIDGKMDQMIEHQQLETKVDYLIQQKKGHDR